MSASCHESQISATRKCSTLQPLGVTVSNMGIKLTVADNLGRLQKIHGAPEHWDVYYQSGPKKGNKVASRTIRNALDPLHQEMPSLVLIEAIAIRFKLTTAELLVDWKHDRIKLIERVMAVKPDEKSDAKTRTESVRPGERASHL